MRYNCDNASHAVLFTILATKNLFSFGTMTFLTLTLHRIISYMLPLHRIIIYLICYLYIGLYLIRYLYIGLYLICYLYIGLYLICYLYIGFWVNLHTSTQGIRWSSRVGTQLLTKRWAWVMSLSSENFTVPSAGPSSPGRTPRTNPC